MYWQNAKVYQKLAERPEEIKNNQPYIIAVAVPRQVNLSKISQQNTGGEIINGVASFQNRINERTNTKKLVLLLADDRGDKSEEVATHIGKFSLNKNFLLGVIGHAQTRVTKEAARIYQGKKIILISPTSTGQIRNNEKQDDYIYKVVFDVKRLAKDIAEIAEKTSSAQNDKVLVISSSNSFADDFLETIRSNFHEGDDKLILETIENAGRLNIKSLTTQNVKVIVINLTVEDRDSREFLNLLRLVSDFAKNPEPNNKKVIFSDTFYNNKNLQDISMQQLCNNPNLQVVTPAWANDELDKELKKDLPKYSHELYSWRINFAFDSALILMSAAEQSKNNLKPETLKDNIKQGKVSPLVHSSATGLENSLPTFDQAGNRHVNQQQKTSQVWTTKLKDGEQCIFTPGSPIFSGVRRKTTQG